MDHVRVI